MSWWKKLATGVGTALGGPVGGLAVGGLLGAGTALLSRGGGGNVEPQSMPGQSDRAAILQQLQGSDGGFAAGAAQLQDQMGQVVEADQASAVRYGMSPEAMIGQAAGRSRGMATGLTSLLSQAQQQQSHGLGMALQATGMDDANYWRAQAQKETRRGQILGALGDAVGSAATIYANRGGGA